MQLSIDDEQKIFTVKTQEMYLQDLVLFETTLFCYSVSDAGILEYIPID